MSSVIRVPRSTLLQALRAAPQQPLRAALEATLVRLQASARNRRGLLGDVLGAEAGFTEWQHYPRNDAVDRHSGCRFYYHAHAAGQRAAGEHGHFHVFATSPTSVANGPDHSHLFALSVDARGMPTRVFTTNRWVTDEHWHDAAWTLRALRRLELSRAQPRRVSAWLQDMALLFAPQIHEVIRQRDLRIAERSRRQPRPGVLEDRRTHIVSQCRVDLARQFGLLQEAGVA